MENSLKTKEKPPKRGANAPPEKGKTKTFLIDKELKTKDLLKTAAERQADRQQNQPQKPESKPRIASAQGRVKPLAQLLRCATALRVTAPLGCGSRRLVWSKRNLSTRSHDPKQPDNQADPPPNH